MATITVGSDFEAPRVMPGSGLQDIRLTDRDVLLARTDLPARNFSVANPQAAVFANHVGICVPATGCPDDAGPIRVERGRVSVDATLRGRTARVVSTHLEPAAPPIRLQQAGELVAGPLNTALPTVLLGDLNSAPGTPPHNALLTAGFTDAWAATRPRDPGFTCCQDANLRNTTSKLTRRIDYVLFRGNVTTLTTNQVGATQADRTPSGLWPSDHAGVRSVLRLR
ncbi:endonuclease/exonuclease/phosphatase family protein [Streptomyces sp. NPDC059874]|uniref:endonuclease/exonuclease/phosphatase family protein n=1 Tax=Streptomyces sp. NPDC059874 TaxID=3346983 RepID=UPI0036609B07